MSARLDDVVTVIYNGEPVQARVTLVRNGSHGASYTMTVHATASRLLITREASDEGVTWMQGHDPTICTALRAAFNLSDGKP